MLAASELSSSSSFEAFNVHGCGVRVTAMAAATVLSPEEATPCGASSELMCVKHGATVVRSALLVAPGTAYAYLIAVANVPVTGSASGPAHTWIDLSRLMTTSYVANNGTVHSVSAIGYGNVTSTDPAGSRMSHASTHTGVSVAPVALGHTTSSVSWCSKGEDKNWVVVQQLGLGSCQP